EVGDLEDAAGAAVVDQERLVTLAAEVGCGALEAEQRRGDHRHLVGREARRRRLEHAFRRHRREPTGERYAAARSPERSLRIRMSAPATSGGTRSRSLRRSVSRSVTAAE